MLSFIKLIFPVVVSLFKGKGLFKKKGNQSAYITTYADGKPYQVEKRKGGTRSVLFVLLVFVVVVMGGSLSVIIFLPKLVDDLINILNAISFGEVVLIVVSSVVGIGVTKSIRRKNNF